MHHYYAHANKPSQVANQAASLEISILGCGIGEGVFRGNMWGILYCIGKGTITSAHCLSLELQPMRAFTLIALADTGTNLASHCGQLARERGGDHGG